MMCPTFASHSWRPGPEAAGQQTVFCELCGANSTTDRVLELQVGAQNAEAMFDRVAAEIRCAGKRVATALELLALQSALPAASDYELSLIKQRIAECVHAIARVP